MFDDHNYHTFLFYLLQVKVLLWTSGRVAVDQNMPIFIYTKSIVLPDRNINDEYENMCFKYNRLLHLWIFAHTKYYYAFQRG